MRKLIGVASLISALWLGGCAADVCDPPEGCIHAESVAGACQCQEWQVTQVETMPLKYVVVGVEYALLGNGSQVAYGEALGTLPAASEMGSRFRAVVRSGNGQEHVATLGRIDVGASAGLVPVTATSGAFTFPGYTVTLTNTVDVPTSAQDRILVWVNPTFTVTTNYLGQRRVDWGWTSVGGCYRPAGAECAGPAVLGVRAGALDGTISPAAMDFYTQEFLTTLTPAERLDILSYDAFYDPAGRDQASFAADPRLLLLGQATVTSQAHSFPLPNWTPCDGLLTDENFGVLHESSAPVAASGDRVLLQHGVLSSTASCSAQQPGLVLATTTPGCEFTATVYMDRMLGTLLTVPGTISASCTVFAPP